MLILAVAAAKVDSAVAALALQSRSLQLAGTEARGRGLNIARTDLRLTILRRQATTWRHMSPQSVCIKRRRFLFLSPLVFLQPLDRLIKMPPQAPLLWADGPFQLLTTPISVLAKDDLVRLQLPYQDASNCGP